MKILKKFLHIITSRHVFCALFIIVGLILIGLLEIYISDAVLPVLIINTIWSVITMLTIINRDSIWETKAPWLLLVALVPALGNLFYWTLGRRYKTFRERKFLKRVDYLTRDNGFYNEPILEEIKQKDTLAYSKAKILSDEANTLIFKNTELKYLTKGIDIYNQLIDLIKNAKHYIFMEFFIVSQGKALSEVEEILISKVKEGVEVFFMYDDIGSFTALKSNYYKKLRKKGINASCFAKFNFMAVASHNNRNHRKIVVVDGDTAMTGGFNLADEYFGFIKRFGEWKDSAVVIRGNAVEEFVREFIFDWDLNNKTKTNLNAYIKIPQDYNYDGFVIPFTTGPRPIHNQEIPKHTLLNIINQAKKYIYLTTPYLINDRESITALANASQRGVEVIIITPHIPDKKITFMLTRSNYKPLVSAGVKIYEYTPGFIHEKMLICDDEYAVVGTINYDYRCFLHHYENALWIYKHPIIVDMKQDFNEIIEESQLCTLPEAKLNIFSKFFVIILKIAAPFF